LKRIGDVRGLRAAQFREDGGPLAHPVQPKSYLAIDNFYTATVYNKGAEVIRMMATIIGREAFRKGMDLYFQRHDNNAVTIEDFVAAMADASGVNLDKFRAWYDQAGTPEVRIDDAYDADRKQYRLTIRQNTKPTPGQPDKQPVVIPVAMGLLDGNGQELETKLAGETAAKPGNARATGGRSGDDLYVRGRRQPTHPVAVPRLFRAGQIVRHQPGAVAVPRRARHRSIRALGFRTAIRHAGAAGPDSRLASRRGAQHRPLV